MGPSGDGFARLIRAVAARRVLHRLALRHRFRAFAVSVGGFVRGVGGVAASHPRVRSVPIKRGQ